MQYEISKMYSSIGILSCLSSTQLQLLNTTSNSLQLSGGISISNTTDASSTTSGGTFTSAGGAAFAKSIYVGLGMFVSGQATFSSTLDAAITTNGGLQTTKGISVGTSLVVNGSTTSTSAATGSLLIPNGSIGIGNTTDASSYSSGGSFTTAGGATISKKLYVGSDLNVLGNVNITGSLSISGASTNMLTTPSITPSATTNVTSVTSVKSVLNQITNQFFYFCLLAITPSAANTTTVVTLSLPSASANFPDNHSVQSQCTGYTASGTAIFQIIAVSVTGTKTIQVSFTSIDTTVHYISLTENYT